MRAAENMPTERLPNAQSVGQSGDWLPFVVLLAIGFSVGYLYCGPLTSEEVPTRPFGKESVKYAPPSAPDDIQLPEVSLSPADIVATQMKALVAYRDNRSAIHQVFAFASPANRSMTGPVERFETMVQQAPYSAMLATTHWMAGRTVSRDRQATTLVTTVDVDGGVSLFRFYLSKQSGQHADCWMTDRVICLFQGGDYRADDGISTQEPMPDAI